MQILWQYLKPHKPIIFLSLLLAGIAQLLSLIDPIIFGKIIDDYATNRKQIPEDKLVPGVLFWLGIAIGVAMLARLAKAYNNYTEKKKKNLSEILCLPEPALNTDVGQ